MKNTLVISRFEENLNWVNLIINKFIIGEIIIYNKGKKNLHFTSDKIKIKNVPNIGREGGTYLDFIIENYDSLPNEIWFTQGNPFIHSPNFLNFFNFNIKMLFNNDFQNLTCRYNESYPPSNNLLNSYDFKNNRVADYFMSKITLDLVGHCSGTVEKYIDKCKTIGFNTRSDYGIYDYLCDRLKIEKPKNIMHQTIASCFFVTNKNILRHNKEVYIELRKFLYQNCDQGGFEGYILERFWNYLLTGKSYNTLSHCYKIFLMNNGFVVGIYENNFLYVIDYKNNPKIYQNENSIMILRKNRNLIQFPKIAIKGIILEKISCKNIEYAHQLFKKYLNKYNNEKKLVADI